MVLPLRWGNSGGFLRCLSLCLLLMAVGKAGEGSWDERLANSFSSRLQEIDRDLATTAPQLDLLPGIPIDDQGGTGGYASIYPRAAPVRNAQYAVEVRWPASAQVELVALVPARRYDARGLDAQYGMPDAFTVELLNAGGEVLACIAREINASKHPVRRGHPFVYQVSPPVEACGRADFGHAVAPGQRGGRQLCASMGRGVCLRRRTQPRPRRGKSAALGARRRRRLGIGVPNFCSTAKRRWACRRFPPKSTAISVGSPKAGAKRPRRHP